ncbi:hypothetical protein GUITHDRAFT_146008 [Guillardia theta CCMP2712]|uniref:histone acetyltransferase n=1 Tax=Guillardia theta (strain CCMP2712) TaxID=905079 RepID=L1IJS9_GUITC|nr:hypothetical protein GUITHDRAFT_146008 [Guillardia theta CCMP2712]EKX36065.1 hypothetical protein GUITHDRAFT_146008 [Guillardia theta CCMP2712]|eukprot:XP_005823045.1 hypothetical protein GUITHDRAFT_146008 [Guillardia theta CCMP2712]
MSQGKEGRKHRRCVPSGSPRQEFLRIEELNGPAIGGAQSGDNKKQKLQEEQEEELYPSPLTPYHFTLILQELPTGARLALQTCLSSWRVRMLTCGRNLDRLRVQSNNFSTDDFISFIKCYTCYSKTLGQLFETRGASSSHGGGARSSQSRDQSANNDPGYEDPNSRPPAPAQQISTEELQRNLRRRQEALKRRFWGMDGPDTRKLGRYLAMSLKTLQLQLPLDGLHKLKAAVSSYMQTMSVEQFAAQLTALVDEYQDWEPARQLGGTSGSTSRSASEPPAPYAYPMSEELGGAETACRAMTDVAREPAGRVSCFQLHESRLGQYLTSKAIANPCPFHVQVACPSHKRIVVKLVSDALRHKRMPLVASFRSCPHLPPASSANSNRSSPYRCKTIFLFMSSQAIGEILIFAMYIQEHFGPAKPDNPDQPVVLPRSLIFSTQIVIECIDSTPLYADENGTERQDILTAVTLAYLEWAKMRGFLAVNIVVPAPIEEKNYIFAYRTLNVRLRTSSHLAKWYKRLLEKGMASNIVTGIQVREEGGRRRRLHQWELKFLKLTKQACSGSGDDGNGGSMSGPDPGRPVCVMIEDDAPFVSSLCTNRDDLVAFLEKNQLKFNSLRSAQMSSMMIVQTLLKEQYTASLVSPLPPPPEQLYPGMINFGLPFLQPPDFAMSYPMAMQPFASNASWNQQVKNLWAHV